MVKSFKNNVQKILIGTAPAVQPTSHCVKRNEGLKHEYGCGSIHNCFPTGSVAMLYLLSRIANNPFRLETFTNASR